MTRQNGRFRARAGARGGNFQQMTLKMTPAKRSPPGSRVSPRLAPGTPRRQDQVRRRRSARGRSPRSRSARPARSRSAREGLFPIRVSRCQDPIRQVVQQGPQRPKGRRRHTCVALVRHKLLTCVGLLMTHVERIMTWHHQVPRLPPRALRHRNALPRLQRHQPRAEPRTRAPGASST